MPDTPLDMLVVRDMPDGTFAVADALQGVRIVQDRFKTRAEAAKFIEDYYLARGIIAPPAPKKIDRFCRRCRAGYANQASAIVSCPRGVPERLMAEAADPEAPSQQHWSLFWTFQSCFPKLCFQSELTQLSPPTERGSVVESVDCPGHYYVKTASLRIMFSTTCTFELLYFEHIDTYYSSAVSPQKPDFRNRLIIEISQSRSEVYWSTCLFPSSASLSTTTITGAFWRRRHNRLSLKPTKISNVLLWMMLPRTIPLPYSRK